MQGQRYRMRDKTDLKRQKDIVKKPGMRRQRRYRTDSVMADGTDRELLKADMEESDTKRSSQRKMRLHREHAPGKKDLHEEKSMETVPEMEEDGQRKQIRQSARMRAVRQRPSAEPGYKRKMEDTKHAQKKNQVRNYVRAEQQKRSTQEQQTASEKMEPKGQRRTQTADDPTLDGYRLEIKEKVKRERLNKEQRKQGRLMFGDDRGTVRGAGAGIAKKAGTVVISSVSVNANERKNETGEDNAALQSSRKTEKIAEKAVRSVLHTSGREAKKRDSRLHGNAYMKRRVRTGEIWESGILMDNREIRAGRIREDAVKRFWQKQRYKKAYLAAKQGKEMQETARVTQTVLVKAKKALAAVAGRNKGILGAVAIIIVLFVLMAMSLSSCGAVFQGTTSSISGTTYASTDEDIYAVENAYKELERSLNAKINGMETSNRDCDEFRYQIDEISHNPYHLISYFTAKYGEFTFDQVKDEIEEIFQQQYALSTDTQNVTVAEKKTVKVGDSLGQVVTSGYCGCPICCGVWSGGPTASGVYATASHTIAVDAASPFVPMGTKVVMNGVEYVVEDTGNFAQYGVQFDVYYSDHSAASAHGHQTWEAYIADDNGSSEVEVTSTKRVKRMDVTVANHSLEAVLRARMDTNERKRYDLYNTTYGHRDYLFDLNTLPFGGSGFGYQIPAEALSDSKFANMVQEAEKYLGYPYVWGGASPSTSFDCSGFVCWVLNNCGNGWNVGRVSANDLRGFCAYVSPEQARPGDLIFFQGTYDTEGASHVGIYVGNNMMLHCGNPIQYTSIASSYWQDHFMAFGRIQ